MKQLFGRSEPIMGQAQVQPRSRLTSRQSTTTTMKKLFGLHKPISLPISQPIERSKNKTPSHQVSIPPSVDEKRDTIDNDRPTLSPVAPQPIPDSLDEEDPEPYIFRQKAKALYPYIADDSTEMSLSIGEIFEIVDKPADDWWQARNKNGLVGLAPSNYFQLL
ncbi:SH3 domain-containing protein [Mycena sanguinolenta]|nr:SH3 domain-containing protein [Mycena sanguinolenta]